MIVYLVTNKKNSKRYVGKTKRTLDQRWREHVRCSISLDTKMVLYAAIRKHGPDAFEKTVLEEGFASVAEMNDAERKWIAELKPEYNMTVGGDGLEGYNHTEETKARMSEARKGEKNHNYGKKWGRTGPLKEITKQRISEAKKGVSIHSEESRDKISEALRKRVRKTKKIVQLRDGQELAIFLSAKDAADAVFGNHCHIREVCLGTTNRKSHRGYEWAYLREE